MQQVFADLPAALENVIALWSFVNKRDVAQQKLCSDTATMMTPDKDSWRGVPYQKRSISLICFVYQHHR